MRAWRRGEGSGAPIRARGARREANTAVNTVLVPLPDGRTLALELEAYCDALVRGQAMVPTSSVSRPDTAAEVLDADGMAERTNVPASWWLEAARRGDVPSLKCGKYRRFVYAKAIEAIERR